MCLCVGPDLLISRRDEAVLKPRQCFRPQAVQCSMFSGLVRLFISMIADEQPQLSRCTSSLRRLVYNDMTASCFVDSSNLVFVPVWVF